MPSARSEVARAAGWALRIRSRVGFPKLSTVTSVLERSVSWGLSCALERV